MAFDKRTLVLPPGTRFEEHAIVAPGDLILGDHVTCAYGVRAGGRLFAGQGVVVQGAVQSAGELRADQSCRLLGDTRCNATAYLGERCFVQGDLWVEGDLDVGDDVRITGRLMAKGWVQKRSPVGPVLYLFIYVLELLRLGHSAQVEQVLREMEGMEGGALAVAEGFTFVPNGSRIGLDRSEVKGGLDAGRDVRILGNLTVRGDAVLGPASRVLGALRCDGDARLHAGAEVQGDLVADGAVTLGEGCVVQGDLHARTVEMAASCTVHGRIVAQQGVSFRSAAQERSQEVAVEKVAEFNGKAADLVDLLG